MVSNTLLMSIIKDRHGTYYVRKKVPQKLEAAVAQIQGLAEAQSLVAEEIPWDEGCARS